MDENIYFLPEPESLEEGYYWINAKKLFLIHDAANPKLNPFIAYVKIIKSYKFNPATGRHDILEDKCLGIKQRICSPDDWGFVYLRQEDVNWIRKAK